MALQRANGKAANGKRPKAGYKVGKAGRYGKGHREAARIAKRVEMRHEAVKMRRAGECRMIDR